MKRRDLKIDTFARIAKECGKRTKSGKNAAAVLELLENYLPLNFPHTSIYQVRT
jgi:histone H3/H4